jgi:GTPase
MAAEAEAVEIIGISMSVDSAGVSAGTSEETTEVSVKVSTEVSAGTSIESVAEGTSVVEDSRIKETEIPNSRAQSAVSIPSGQQYVFPAPSEVQ